MRVIDTAEEHPMPKETIIRYPDASPEDAPAQPAPAPSSDPNLYIVVHDTVSNWLKGGRVTIDHLFHKDHPGRDAAWERLIRLGAIKPASDPEAAALPETQPLPTPPPIMMANVGGQLTVPLKR